MRLIKILVTAVIMLSLSITCYSEDMGSITEDINITLPGDTEDSLSDFGITRDEINPDSLSIERLIPVLINTVAERGKAPFTMLCSLCIVILLSSMARTLSDAVKGRAGYVFDIITLLISSAVITGSIINAINSAKTTLDSAGVFVSGFIPGFAGMVTMGGNVTFGAAMNMVIMTAIQLFMQICLNIIMPVCICITAMSLASAVDNSIAIDKLSAAAKKILIFAMGFMMTVFVALLGIQSFITLPSDSIGLKTVRFTVSNAVPFVGGAISDSLQTMQGGLAIIRNNFGTFGIISGAVIVIPPLIECLLYKLALSFCGGLSDTFGTGPEGTVIKSAEGVMSVILAMLACFLLMTVVSLSLMLFMVSMI